MQFHILITLYEAFAGFTIAIILSFIIAILMDSLTGFKKTVYPILIISQTIPIIILAPLFIIWFGYGYTPKIIIVILICFFPITVSLAPIFDLGGQGAYRPYEINGCKQVPDIQICKNTFSYAWLLFGFKDSSHLQHNGCYYRRMGWW